MALNLVNNKKYCNIWTLCKTNQLKYYTKALICITHLSLKLKMSETLMLFSKKNRWILESYQTSNTFLLSKSYNYLGAAHVVRHWEPLFTFSKKNNVKVVWYWNKFLCLHQPNFKIILLKRLKQLFTKLIWPLPKNGQTNLEIRVIFAEDLKKCQQNLDFIMCPYPRSK